jgi:chromosome segregation ATPase
LTFLCHRPDQLTTTGEELTKLKQELAERDEMFAALHQDIDKKSEDIDKLRSEIADWQTIGETGKLSLDKVSAELQVAQQQVTEQQARLLQVEADRDAFHRQLMDLNSKTADMVASKDREIRKLNTEKEDLVSKLAASTRELDDTKAQWKRTQLDLERSNTEIASLKLEQEICAEESAQTKLELATKAAELKALQSAPKRTPTPIPRRTASPVREEPEQAPEQDERDTGKPPAMPITSTPTKRTLYRKGTHANAVDDEQPTDEEGKRGSRHEKKSRTESSSQAALTARKQAASSQRSRALDVTSRASPKVEEETPRKGPRTKKSPSSSKHHQKPSKSDDNGGDIFACDITDT